MFVIVCLYLQLWIIVFKRHVIFFLFPIMHRFSSIVHVFITVYLVLSISVDAIFSVNCKIEITNKFWNVFLHPLFSYALVHYMLQGYLKTKLLHNLLYINCIFKQTQWMNGLISKSINQTLLWNIEANSEQKSIYL